MFPVRHLRVHSTPVDYRAQPGSSSQQYDPTILASGPGASPEQSGPPQYDSTIPASPYYASPPQGIPSTAYGSQPYGMPQQNDFGAPYTPAPPMQNLYNNPYADPYAPPPPAQAPYPQGPGGFMPQPGQPPRPRTNKTGLIIGIAALVLVLIVAGVFGVLAFTGKNNQSQISPTATSSVPTSAPTTAPTTAPTSAPTQPASPSGLPIDSTALSIVTNAQTASAVNSNAQPTQLSSSFALQQTIYATFDLQLNGQTGFAEAKWYADGQLILTSSILNISNPTAPGGYIAAKYSIATQNGAVELYWCTQSDCSDAALAGVVDFTVS